MLLGVEKKRKEEEELEAKSSLRSEAAEVDEGRSSAADSCKDVECSTSTEMSSGGGGHRSRDYPVGGAKARSHEEVPVDSESLSSGFEFQKAERAPPHRSAAAATAYVPPFSKPLPSKWDDAQKWIASPTSNRGGRKAAGAGQAKRGSIGGRMGPAKEVVLEVEEADTKWMDGIQPKKDFGGLKPSNWASEPYAALDPVAKPALAPANPVADSAVLISRQDSSAVNSTTAIITPSPTVKSVSMRDMGTEMTPIASQEPSRTGTPIRATSPQQSPGSSRTSTPQRRAPDLTGTESVDCTEDTNSKDMSDKDLQMKTRREIMVLGQQLGKTSIAAWAGKKEAETNESISLRTVAEDQPPKNIVDGRATAWEEAEKANYLARINELDRLKREEIKIQAWENHQRAKTEAEIRRIEVEVERMRTRAHEKLTNQLADARHKAEEKRLAAEAKRNKQAAKTAEQADYIRKTGRIPFSFSCWGWCS